MLSKVKRIILFEILIENFEARKHNVENIVKQMQEKYGQDAVVLEMNDQYYNMLEKLNL